MYSVEADRTKRIFVIDALGHVSAAEVRAAADELKTLLQDAPPGFAVVADFRRLDSMNSDGAREIGKIMDLFAEKQVALVIRVVPDARKDVGLNILSLLHYGAEVEVVTVTTMAEAMAIIGE